MGVAVGGAALLAGACVAVLCLRKRGRCGGRKPGDAADNLGGPLGAKQHPQGSKSTGATDAMTDVPSLKDQDSIPSSTQPPTAAASSDSPAGSRMGLLVKAGGSPCNSSGGMGAASSGVSTGGPSWGGGGRFGGLPQSSVSMIADNGPFAMFTMDSQGDMPLNHGMSVVAPASASTGTTARSSGRGSSSRVTGASDRSNNSGGSNQASDESGRDGLAPLPLLDLAPDGQG